jgi:nitronate monooxygenase
MEMCAVGNILPVIIQGGMGAGVSNWRLAQAVSRIGQLGVVSGTGLDQIFARRLQEGDPGGHMRRALQAFPLRGLAQSIMEAFYVPGGRKPGAPFKVSVMHTIEGRHGSQSLCIAANFAEVFLAREGHGNPVGINYLEKIQLPHLPSLYGAMLAGVAVVIVGAGIPFAVPAALDALAMHQPATYPIYVSGALAGADTRMLFNPRLFWDADTELPGLSKPYFLPIVASEALAAILSKRASGGISGFVVEGPLAGGHNAPPRGKLVLGDDGQPVYGPRDQVAPAAMRDLGLPFWLAGSYGTPARLKEALSEGAAGIQVGTAFALCSESGMDPEVRRALILKALAGEARVFTDPRASPTGFPFKVAQLEGTLSDENVYRNRKRICDLGFLREPYRREDGSVGYRCPAEPEAAYVAKGGKAGDTEGRKCLCNALVANIGMPQCLSDGTREKCLITLGDDFAGVGRFCSRGQTDYTAADVVRILLG